MFSPDFRYMNNVDPPKKNSQALLVLFVDPCYVETWGIYIAAFYFVSLALGVKGVVVSQMFIDFLFSPRSLENYTVILCNILKWVGAANLYIYIYKLKLKTWVDFGMFGRRVSFCEQRVVHRVLISVLCCLCFARRVVLSIFQRGSNSL